MRSQILTCLLSLGLGFGVWAASQAAPLVAFPREANEGMVWDYNTIQLGNQTLSGSLQGIGSPGMAGMMYKLGGEWEMLEAYVGYTKGAPSKRSCKFAVLCDQEQVYLSPEIKGGDEPIHIRVPIEGKQQMMVQIQPVTYGGSLGACFGAPTLKRGLTAEEKLTPYTVQVNGQRLPYTKPNAPADVPVTLPVKPGAGETIYQVKIIHDPQGRRVDITTTP